MRAQAKSSFHWDKRGKKYVKLQAGEVIKGGKRVKNEAGAKVGGWLGWLGAGGCCAG